MKNICYVCESHIKKTIFKYIKPAFFLTSSNLKLTKRSQNENIRDEIIFSKLKDKKYLRKVLYCNNCYHFQEDFNHFVDYKKDYLDKSYGSTSGLEKEFYTIINIPKYKSDNKNRVKFIKNFFKNKIPRNLNKFKVLDVGMGLGVFLYEMKKLNWSCIGTDQDQRYIKHSTKNLKIRSFCKEFKDLKFKNDFDLITLNKVLEHLKDPKKILKQINKFIDNKTYLYLELPDPISSKKLGKNREEFLMGHVNLFSHISILILLQNLNYKVTLIDRIREPSGKFTIRVIANLDDKYINN